jgi:hypothetical protein
MNSTTCLCIAQSIVLGVAAFAAFIWAVSIGISILDSLFD